MWDFSKKTLFLLMLTSAVGVGFSIDWIDWEVFKTRSGILKEIQIPLVFIFLSIIFMLKYVKKLKSEKT
tara:strand:+ start:45977 stop:46183 length:207 start_codon:yes stop_codon:yes gene_type:complete